MSGVMILMLFAGVVLCVIGAYCKAVAKAGDRKLNAGPRQWDTLGTWTLFAGAAFALTSIVIMLAPALSR